MKKIFSGFSMFVISGVFLGIFSTSSCKKETDCTAIVTITDTNGVAVPNVNLYVGPPAPIPAGQTAIEQTGLTDASGKATFVFKLEATMDITASIDTRSGNGIVTLKPGETVEKTVVIQ